MESVSSVTLVTVIIFIQVLWCGVGESQPCSPGFGSDLFRFRVPKEDLQSGRKIGTIAFNDCSGRTQPDFVSTDRHYDVDPDGTIKMKRGVTLRNGHQTFSVHAWDSSGKKHTASVRVEHQVRAGHQHGQQEDVGETDPMQVDSSSELLVLEFPKSDGLRRRKREWVIPPIRIMEEDQKGPFPKTIAQIKSSHAKETKMAYSITGEGADLPPVGLFSINRNTGLFSVSRPLDRETKDFYVLQVHAQSLPDNIKEPPMEVIIEVIDQNDNPPIFTQNPFTGNVPEASQLGHEFMTISATDADDPNTLNADIRYSIERQIPDQPYPNMFAINPLTGAIRVNADGLDREIYHVYTLDIRAADMEGKGLFVMGQAVVTVSNGNDKPSEELEIPPIMVTENDQRHFPKKIGQIKYSNPKISSVRYTIGGHGADLPPVGLFLIQKNTGELFVARPLDRETRDKYVLQAHIVGDHYLQQDMVEFTINVVDQNDNKPVFTQDTFVGTISDASKRGHEVMKISATDADDPNTDNADIRYSIISQSPPEPHPNMFQVNPISGVILVNAEGLDSQKYSKYVLKIQATDMQGKGFSSTGDAVISITDSKEDILNLSPGTWEISPICIPENSKGPFPKQLVKIKSGRAKEAKIVYSITGAGADQPPVGIFTMDKETGWVSVTKPLDRETKHEYVLQAHATGGGVNEPPTEITIRVIDQNDNKPVFSQDSFSGSVPEASKKGFEFMAVTATDADDPKIENGIINYSIISQDPALPHPNMFEIDVFSGAIQVNAEGFDRQKYPVYTLEIQAADMQGNGHQSRAKAVITVTA